jgi:ATPase subunit of ABC transporter with duplicated ATPase domains
MAAISIRGLRKSYGAAEVLRGIDLEVKAGEFVVLVGPSGCGKSTLLRLIAGLETASSGDIRIDGKLVNGLAPKDLSAHERARQHEFQPETARHAARKDRGGRARGQRDLGDTGVAGPQAQSPVGRPKAAGRDGARHGALAAGLPLR